MDCGSKTAKKYTWNELGLDGKIIDVVMHGGSDLLVVLTEKGSVYGMGQKGKLGIGENSSSIQHSFIKLNLENIISITNTKEAIIAINNRGQVFGTGNNLYGVLGRWKGEDRGSSNSRYRTAINWVECPELEI